MSGGVGGGRDEHPPIPIYILRSALLERQFALLEAGIAVAPDNQVI